MEWHGMEWDGMEWSCIYFLTRRRERTDRRRDDRDDRDRTSCVDASSIATSSPGSSVKMRARGTTTSGGGDGGGFSSKIMGLKVRARRAKEGWGEREREGIFLSRA